MAHDVSDNKTELHEFKERPVKAARMYAMCQKAGVPEPLDVTGLTVAAFEDMPLKQALLFGRTNEQNLKDLAWAFSNSKSPRSSSNGPRRSRPYRNAASHAGRGTG